MLTAPLLLHWAVHSSAWPPIMGIFFSWYLLQTSPGATWGCCLTSYQLRKEPNTHLNATSFQVVIESDEVSPQPPFHQTELQFLQTLLIHLVFLSFHQPCSSLHMLEELNIFFKLRSPKLNTGFEVRSHQGRVQGDKHFLVLLSTIFLMQARML